MASIVLRSVKGSPLTIEEADSNFTNLNIEVGQKLNTSDYTALDILNKLKTVDGPASGLDADLLDGLSASSANVSSTVVARDSSGNFSAGTITAFLLGNVQGNVSGSSSSCTGNALNVTGIVSINNGGTGATTVETARTALGIGTLSTQSASSVSITGGSITGITDLAVADGGTGASNAAGARTNLGLVVGADVQPFSALLTGFSGLATNGILVKTGTNSAASRTIAVSTNLSIINADGISGNITISGTQTPTVTSIIKSGTNAVGDIGQTANRFGTIFGTSTSALYADLAEKYTTDKEYEPGTVVVVSFDFTENAAEATSSFEYGQRVLGVVSTNPAFLMNDTAPGQAIALRGRVPVKVAGPIRKGQPLVANQDGRGIAGDLPNSFAIALETNFDQNVKLVECVIL